MVIIESKKHYLFIVSQEYVFAMILGLYDGCNVKEDAITTERASLSACRGPAGQLVPRPRSPAEPVSLRARSAHSRRTGNSCVKEGETAGVKATFWPEVKSTGLWLMAISESKGLLYVQGMHISAATPMLQMYPVKNGRKWILFLKEKEKPFKAKIQSTYMYISLQRLAPMDSSGLRA